MSQSSIPRSLSWTSLFILTLVAALLESLILFPTTLVPGTRLAAALSWDASNPGGRDPGSRDARPGGDPRRAGPDPGHLACRPGPGPFPAGARAGRVAR